MAHQCPECGKFLAEVTAMINGLGKIVEVVGICKTCEVVHPTDWDYDDFFPEPELDTESEE